MLDICLCDDDSMALSIAQTGCQSFFSDKGIDVNIECFSSGKELLEESQSGHFKLAILDIDMPDINGIELADKLTKQNFNITVMFLSQREDLVFECLSVHPFAFIRKGRFVEDLRKAMTLYVETVYNREDDQETLTIKKKTGMLTLAISEILYIEGKRNYQVFHLRNGEKVESRVLMRDLENALLDKGFLRIQKGFLSNARYIRRLNKKTVLLANGVELPLSTSKSEEIMQRFLDITRDTNLTLE